MGISAAFLENLVQYLKAFKGAPLSHTQLSTRNSKSFSWEQRHKGALESIDHQPQLKQEAITCQVKELPFLCTQVYCQPVSLPGSSITVITGIVLTFPLNWCC